MKGIDLMEAIANLDERMIADSDGEPLGEADRRRPAALFGGSALLRGILTAAACVLLFSIVLPNSGGEQAYALQNIPLIGSYFQLVTFRKYSYQGKGHSAEVSIPKLEASSSVNSEAAEEVNRKITEISDRLISEFKEEAKEEGYSSLEISSKLLLDDESFYCLRLTALSTAADSYEENRYYTIRKSDGKLLSLKDLFLPGTDYESEINAELRRQMQEEMEKDPGKKYWLDDPEMKENNFRGIREDQAFYLNEKGELILSFPEGEIAPMYMGECRFLMPSGLGGFSPK